MVSPAPDHVAIVGCGFTGTSAFFQLVDTYVPRAITIFEASGEFGPGYPYRPSEAGEYLINNTTDSMCLAPSNRRAFIDWLRGHPEVAGEVDERGHLPRAIYGLFLKDVVAATRTMAAVKGVAVRLIAAAVDDLWEDAEGGVTLRYGEQTLGADMVILANGRCPDLDAYPAPTAAMKARYYPTHIPGRLLDDIPGDAACHVLGASLSAYDVVNKLFSPQTGCRFERGPAGVLHFVADGNGRSVVLCSRGGRLKKMQSRRPGEIERRHFTDDAFAKLAGRGEATLANIVELIMREADDHRASLDWETIRDPYGDRQTEAAVTVRAAALLEADLAAACSAGDGPENFLVDLFLDAQMTIWNGFASGALSLEDERAYRSLHETAMLSYVAACPIIIAERLLALMRAGRLKLLRGVSTVSLNEADDCYDIAHRHGVAKADVLINATGAVDRRVDSADQPALITNLRHRGLLKPYAKVGVTMNGAAVDMANFRAEGARNIYVADQFLWGPGFFVSSALMMATIVERLLAAAFAKPVSP